MASLDTLGGMPLRTWEALLRAIPPGEAAALVGFPETKECGDHAAWLGMKALLVAAGRKPPVYECSAESYAPGAMRETLGGGTIVLAARASSARPATGTTGMDFLLRLLADFPANRVVLLPQTVSEADDAALQVLATAVGGGNRDLIVFASTPNARAMLARHLGAAVMPDLVPDVSWVLGPQQRPAQPVYDIVWLARTDSERRDAETETAARLVSAAAEKLPLPVFPDGIELSFVIKHRPPTVLLTDWRSLVFDNQEARLAMKALDYDSRANAHVERAQYLLSLGHCVVTDRLDAHIQAFQLGIPHILVNTRSGRNADVFRTWMKESALCRLAETPAEAWTMARQVVAQIKDAAAKD